MGGGNAFSQNILSGTSLTPFSETEKQVLAEKIHAFDLFQFPVSDLNVLLKAAGESSTTVRFQFGDQYDWSMTIEENDIRSAGFQIVEMTDDGPIYHPKSNAVNTYKGFIDGDMSQWVRCFVSDSKFSMSFLVDGVAYRVSPVSRYLAGHQNDDSFLIFKQRDMVDTEGACATQMEQSIENAITTPTADPKVRFLELATDADYEFYQMYKDEGSGTAIENVNNRIDEILNEVDQIYSDPRILLNIQHVVSNVWSSSNDPYSNSTDIIEKWDEFKTKWNSDFKCTQRDAAILLSGKSLNALGVVKYHGVGGICGDEYTNCGEYYQFSYAVVRDNGVGSGHVGATTAHELGHILGLQHQCNYCDLMNPGGNGCNPHPCDTGNSDFTYQFAEKTIEKLNNILTGMQHKCNGAVFGDFPRDNCLISPAVVVGNEVIDVNTIWTAETVPNGGKLSSLSIANGASLTLMSDVTLSFPIDGTIDIEEGTLYNYGRLTSCDDHWEGVTVWGDGTLNSVSSYIGKPKSIIEKAQVGIKNENGPGVVKVDHAKFLNNEVAIKLDGVVNFNDPISSTPSESRVKFCEFRVDESISGNLIFQSFIDLHKMNMTNWDHLRGNEFYLAQAKPSVPNWGIIARSSSITAGFNKLEGLHTGLDVEGGFVYALGNNIIGNKYGMFLRGVTLNKIYLNQFHLGNLPDTYLKSDCTDPNIPNCADNQQYGLIVESAVSGFRMSENVFRNEQGNPYISTFGTLCTDMGENDYQIRDNFFSELTIANVAHKINGRIESGVNEQNGLKYLCNHLTYNSSDFFVTSDPTSIIQPRQGLVNGSGQSLPAYNKFSFSLPSASWDYRNHHPSGNSAQYVYYYDQGNPNTIPREGHYENTNIEPSQVDDDYCIVKPSDPGPGGPGTGEPGKGKLGKDYPSIIEKSNNRNRYFEAYQAYQTASVAKEQAAIQNNMTLLDQKSKESQYYRAEADDAAYLGYLYAVLDTTGGDADSIPVWLERMHTFEAEVSRADWYRQKGDLATSNLILDQLPTSFNLSASYLKDLALYQSLREIDNNDELDNATFYQLEETANSDFRMSSAFAKNILSQHGVYYPPIPFEMPEELKKTDTRGVVETKLKVAITPNPSSAYVLFDWSQFNLGSDVVTIELRDRLGSLLKSINSSPGQYTMELSLEAYKDGVIFYYLRHNEKQLDSGQVILNK